MTVRFPTGRNRRACCRALTASPGAVEFGEAYLSWSERGLRWRRSDRIISTSTSWPMTAPFRSSMPIGSSSASISAPGRGASRCSSFRRGPSLHDYPEMTASFARATAQMAMTEGCTEVEWRRGCLFRRRPAPHHRGDGDSVVGARHRRRRRRERSCAPKSPSLRGIASAGCRCRAAPEAAMNDPEALADDAARATARR